MDEQTWLTSGDSAAMLKGYFDWCMLNAADASHRKLRLFACACLAMSDPVRIKEAHCEYNYGEEGERIASVILLEVVTDWCESQRSYDPPKSTKADLLREIFGNPFRPVSYQKVYRCKRCWKTRSMYVDTCCDEYTHALVIPDVSWVTPIVVSLAQAAYDDRPGRKCEKCDHGTRTVLIGEGEFKRIDYKQCDACDGHGRIQDGSLDPQRLAVLADALEEAMCDNEETLRHLRGWEPCSCRYGYGPPPNKPQCSNGWTRRTSFHVRGCHVLDTLLGKE
jgi:hypothetical protein